jgi:hypothetical protein
VKPDTLQNLVGPLNDFLRDNSPRISGILSNTEIVTAQVAQQVTAGEGTVGKLIQDRRALQHGARRRQKPDRNGRENRRDARRRAAA